MDTQRKIYHHPFIAGILSAFCMALSQVFTKLAYEAPWEMVLFFRFAFSFLLIIPWLYHHEIRLSIREMPKHLSRSLAGFFSIAASIYAVQRLPLIEASTLFYTAPLFIPLLVYFCWHEVVPAGRFWGSVIGFGGILAILRPGIIPFSLPMAAALLTGFLSAVAQMLIRRLSAQTTTHTILGYYFFISSCLALPLLWIGWESDLPFTLWLSLGALGITACLAQYFMTISFTHAPASTASALTYITVIFAGFFGWLFWDNQLNRWELVGVCLILGGGLLSLFDRRPARPRVK